MTLVLLTIVAAVTAARLTKCSPTAERLGLAAACGLIIIACGLAGELRRLDRETVRLDADGNRIERRSLEKAAFRKGWYSHAEKNRTELETIKRAQETLLRERGLPGGKPDDGRAAGAALHVAARN